jgi:biotin-dependent carboxylase-like uncharacterized protein
MTRLVVKACGPRTSLQDRGRIGFQRFGVAMSGGMDPLALCTANLLVGNEGGAAAIEFMLLGGAFVLEEGERWIAVAGAPCTVSLDGVPVPQNAACRIRAGQTLTIGPMHAGVYAYLAVEGSFDVPPRLGSRSLHQRARLGGLHGRALMPEDGLPLGDRAAPAMSQRRLPPVSLHPSQPIRVVLGPQDDHFTAAGIETFLTSEFSVTQEADRMGYRLAGPGIEHAAGYNIVSDGIVSGSIQVPGSGEPIVMMADRQTTGGYPKIATVISADLRVMAQRRPGDPVRFAALSVSEAQDLARERARMVASLPGEMREAREGLPPLEELLALNLAGAAVDALSAEQDIE